MKKLVLVLLCTLGLLNLVGCGASEDDINGMFQKEQAMNATVETNDLS